MNMPLVLLNRRRRAGGFSPYVALFANDERGVFLDPSDTANLSWRRNLLTWTEQFDNAAWTATRATVSANSDVAPNGTTTADKLVPNTDNNTHFINRTLNLVGTYTLSAFFKASGYSRVLFSDGSGLAKGLDVDIQNGTIVSTGSSVSNGFVQAVGNGWFRVSFTITDVLGFTTFIDNGSGLTFAGNGTSGILLWGAQLEVGSTASTYQVITDLNTEVRANFPNATLYQDTAGTTPVTTPGQSVALALDKSRGLVLGSERLTNGDFASGATGWDVVGADATHIATFSNGTLRYQSDTTSPQLIVQQNLVLTIGKTYLVEVVVSSWVSGSIKTDSFGGNTVLATGTGTRQFRVTATATSFQITRNSTNVDLTIDNVSIRELPGNHATQATAGSRPLYALLPANGVRNLLTWTEDMTNAAWSKQSLATAPSAKSISFGADGFSRLIQTISIASAASLTLTFRFLPSDAGKVVRLGLWASGLDGLSTGNSGNLTIPSNGVVSFTWSSVTSATTVGIINSTAAAAQTLTLATNGGAQLELGSTATNYQRVDDRTNIVEPPFAQVGALLFDGVDDFLQTPSVDFSATDKMTVFAGVRKLSDATVAIVAELTANLNINNGAFYLAAPQNAGLGNTGFSSKGTVEGLASFSSFPSPATAVLTGIGDISGDISTHRRNGVQVSQVTTDQGTGNYSNAIIYIGRRGGGSVPFNGYLHSLIVRGAATDTATIQLVERWVGQRTGVTI